ncbi:HAD family hydrolase [Anaerocolumna cellulosilytica]|nr:HAD family hydrolase [Anaerocolumna cellulosilytica]MBB5194459.1 putative HAD superfamily hydrolase [Anaerocolumna cellulosilytica]
MQSNLKVMAKERVRTLPPLNIEKIKKCIEGYSYVSFDIFDTLLKRTVEKPSHIFYLAAEEFKKRTGQVILDYETMRSKAEIHARAVLDDKKSKAGQESPIHSEEITLTDIYRQINGLTVQDKEILMQIEYDLELQLCCENKDMKKLFEWCLENNKKVLCISDIYLPASLIEEMLTKCGYTAYDRLYLSSLTGFKKSTGSLFLHVLKSLKISEKELVHIGDSFQSDYLAANKLGIKSVLVPNKINQLSRDVVSDVSPKDKLAYQILQAMINCTMPSEQDEYYRFGYETFGILLHHFNRWLKKDLEKRNISKIFFFSRDGKIMKAAFDTMYPESGLKEHYICVSRRSLRVPQLWFQSDLNSIVYGFPAAKYITMETFLINIGLEPDKYMKELKECGLTLSTVVKRSEISASESLVAFYGKIKPDMVANSRKEYDSLLRYLKANDFYGEVAVVDIGWRGSLQYFLQQITEQAGIPVNMHGYYISLSKDAKWDLDIQGYVGNDAGKNGCMVWKPFVGLAETLFMALEGSAKKYTCSDANHTIEPILYPFEYVKNGKLLPEALHVKAIQEGAISYINTLKHYPTLTELTVSSLSAFAKIIAVGNTPNRKELNMFANFQFLDEKVTYLAKPAKLKFYLTAPKQLKQDLWSSRWKVGFLKRLLHLPFNYVKLYKVLSSLKE